MYHVFTFFSIVLQNVACIFISFPLPAAKRESRIFQPLFDKKIANHCFTAIKPPLLVTVFIKFTKKHRTNFPYFIITSPIRRHVPLLIRPLHINKNHASSSLFFCSNLYIYTTLKLESKKSNTEPVTPDSVSFLLYILMKL